MSVRPSVRQSVSPKSKPPNSIKSIIQPSHTIPHTISPHNITTLHYHTTLPHNISTQHHHRTSDTQPSIHASGATFKLFSLFIIGNPVSLLKSEAKTSRSCFRLAPGYLSLEGGRGVMKFWKKHENLFKNLCFH